MAQFNPQAQQGGGRGGGAGAGGGRGYQGRGGPQQQQQQGRPMGAWQPTAPTSSLQQAAYGRQPQQPAAYHHHNQHLHQNHMPPAFHVNAPHPHYNPYAQQPYQARQGAPGQWQAAFPPQGGVYYPPTQAIPIPPAGTPVVPVVVPPKPREKKPLVITDKDGNVLDFRSETAQKKSSLKAAVAAEKPVAPASDKPGTDAGSKLKEAALAAIKGEELTKPQEAPKQETPLPASAVAAPPAESAPAVETKSASEPPKKQPEMAVAPPPGLSPVPASEPPKTVTPEPSPAATSERVVDDIKPPVTAKEENKEEPPKPNEPASTVEAVKSGGSSLLAATAKKPQVAAASVASAPAPSPSKPTVGLRPGGKTRAVTPSKGRLVYDKKTLMTFKTAPSCMKRPDSLPDMSIIKGPAKAPGGGGGGGGGNRGGGRGRDGGDNRGGGGGGGGNWDRGQQQPNRRNSQNRGDNNNNGDNWQRGQAPPRGQKGGRGTGGRRGSQNGANQPALFDGPVAPLVLSENRWKPVKNTSPLMAAEKQVKGILNKMTKEKFDRLSAQMIDIQILSYDMLTMMIHNVYEKAIDEPSFGDMYADLCVKLSKGAAQANNDFVKVIESDEEPPTEGDAAPGSSAESSSHIVYRWSNDVSTTDSEVVGPFTSVDACIEAAIEGSGVPQQRGEMVLELVKLVIKKGIFVKVMKKKKEADSNEDDVFYTVYFNVSEAEECGQQLSEIFLSEVECISNAKKKNSFKRSLLNKCEDEFKKQDIYVDWMKEKKEYEESKSKLTPAERAEREESLNFRRIKIKKQMLGNVKFIGQLYKKTLLKEKIMRFCIGSLLKLEELTDVKSKNPEYKDTGDMDMDEEDHEAICSLFATIGSTIDKPPAADFMNVCFTKILKLSQDTKNLPARSRFMYKDLLELRENNWVPRRDEGKAKSLEEIRKDFEREEKKQAQQAQQGYRNDSRRGSTQAAGYDTRRGSNFGGGRGGGVVANKNRPSVKQETDEEGFTVIGRGGAKGHFQGSGGAAGGSGGVAGGSNPKPNQGKQSPLPKSGSKSNLPGASEERKSPTNTSAPAPVALSPDKLERRIKSMRTEFMQDPNNINELLLSMDELKATKDSGVVLVSSSGDALLDCKEEERKAISEIIRVLYENDRLSKDDIRSGLDYFIEFIDGMEIDCPRIYDYVGDLLSMLFKLNAVDVQWLCDTLEKTKANPNAQAAEKLTRATISSVRSHDGPSAAKDTFGKSSTAMNGLLGADKWNAISIDLLG